MAVAVAPRPPPPCKMWDVEMMVVVVIGLLAMVVQPSMQQNLRTNPVHSSWSVIDDTETPAIGLIVSSALGEKALMDSGIFEVTSYVDLLGRRFIKGTILGTNVVYVLSTSRPSINMALTVQLLASSFKLRGIIHYGTAGAVDDLLSYGTVVVPSRIAFTGNWEWKEFEAKRRGQLDFKKFNYPENGDNLLGSVQYQSSKFYHNGVLENKFWLPVSPDWLHIASQIKEVETAEVVVGLNASTADVHISNYAYGKFLWRKFHVSIVDFSSAAVALGALSNDLPYIVIRGVSSLAGGIPGNATERRVVANANAVKAVKQFIFLLNEPSADNE